MNLRIALLCLVLATGCAGGRMLIFQFSDIRDEKRFPVQRIEATAAGPAFHHAPRAEIGAMRIPLDTRYVQLDSILDRSRTVAFLVMHNDTVLYERYPGKAEGEDRVPSFSMAKSVVSALTGAALADGYIGSVEDSMTHYLTDLRGRGLEGVRIRHLLQMTSGIDHSENYFNPFSGAAKLYYGNDLDRQMRHLELEWKPGHSFEYLSANTQLLGQVVATATGKSLGEYFQEKIAKPLGMESDITWSTDRRGRAKAFCCLNATARDFARFGLLYLWEGNWHGKQVLPREWVMDSRAIDSNDGAVWYYQYQWWIPSKDGDFYAAGHLGQYIYVDTKRDLVMVRLGAKEGGIRWVRLFRDLAPQLGEG